MYYIHVQEKDTFVEKAKKGSGFMCDGSANRQGKPTKLLINVSLYQYFINVNLSHDIILYRMQCSRLMGKTSLNLWDQM